MVKIEMGCLSSFEAPVVIILPGTNDSANGFEDCGRLNRSIVGSWVGDMFIGVAGAVLVSCSGECIKVFNKGIEGVFNS